MISTVVRTVAALRQAVRDWRLQGLTVGLVPTMGALHEGHLSLVRTARARNDRVIVSIFVNPKQFNSGADLDAYPRTEDADLAKLATLGAPLPLVYAPSAREMYPEGFATTVSVAGVSAGLCGGNRPGHFDGVATVVSKLFLQSGADVAYFGEKDFQQVQVVERMVRDLDIPITVVPCPTVRDADGLALSSRNVFLSAAERAIAARLPAVLRAIGERIASGRFTGATLAEASRELLDAGFRAVDYLELRRAGDFTPVAVPDGPARLLAAAWLGNTRLIDNIAVAPPA